MASKEIVLSISDLEQAIGSFEKKYGMSSNRFLVDQQAREALPEDDVFEWEAFIDHRNELEEIHQELHREYLSQLSSVSGHADGFKPEDKLCLAA
jgi:hypothetical protein